MKATEAAALLTIAAAYDNRKPDADQARAWAMVLEDLRFEDCREAVVNHYRKSRDWLMPVEVVEGVKKIRNDRLLKFTGSMTPPPELADDPRAEIEWVTDRRRRVMDGEWPDDSHVPAAAIRRDVVKELGHVGQRMPARE